MIRNDEIQTNSNPKTSRADSNLRLQCEVSGTLKDLPRLRLRDEARNSEIRRVGGGIGRAYVNDVRYFSIKMGEEKRTRVKWHSQPSSECVNAQLNGDLPNADMSVEW
ncbi:hypothetical protein AVEN_11653-1 [Araneus ventricosus]|uniref:Uncharacterized protein n=1 Tax=Araneus ventricosus TaxID=182803 RepID=A0A4Y2CKN2_ARAVE|nr:hypothetical protein AVEN_11653-1 [Araneus ventricosus]